MRAYTFIGGKLFDHIRIDVSDPPMLLLGMSDVHTDGIVGDCGVVSIDTDDPPIFIDGVRRSFSQASYFFERQHGHTLCVLRQDWDAFDDRALVRIKTRGPNKGILGRFEVLSGDPVCLVKGFGVDGTLLFKCSQLEKHKPPIAIFTGKWNEGLFLLSPGDALVVIPQCSDQREYLLEYTKLYGLKEHFLLVSRTGV